MRSDDLARRFPPGTKVKVGNLPLYPAAWPRIVDGMYQFFDNPDLELTVLGHFRDASRPGQLALILNTSKYGTGTNYAFLVDWVSEASVKAKLTPYVRPVVINKIINKNYEPVGTKTQEASTGLAATAGGAILVALGLSALTKFSASKKKSVKTVPSINVLDVCEVEQVSEKQSK